MAAPTTQSQSTAFAVTSLVTGITGLVLLWVPFLGFSLSVLGVIFGALGVRKTTGKGMAMAGLITGIIGAGIWAILFLVGFVAGLSGLAS